MIITQYILQQKALELKSIFLEKLSNEQIKQNYMKFEASNGCISNFKKIENKV